MASKGLDPTSECLDLASCYSGAQMVQRPRVWAHRACPWVFFFLFYFIY